MGQPCSQAFPESPPLDSRDLSSLAFNERVLQQALDPDVPLLERLRFLCISAGNLDEFFEVRVARLRAQVSHALPLAGPDGRTPAESLVLVRQRAHALIAAQHSAFREVLLPALAAQGLRIVAASAWTPAQELGVLEHLRTTVAPLWSVDPLPPTGPVPHLENKALAFLVVFGDGARALAQVPPSLPRVLPLAREPGRPGRDFALLCDALRAHMAVMFPSRRVSGCTALRVTRDSDLWLEEEDSEDDLQALRGQLDRRGSGAVVRLDLEPDAPPSFSLLLQGELRLGPDDVYPAQGPLDLQPIAALVDLAERPDLRDAPHRPRQPADLDGASDLFGVVRRGDVLLHHPYDAAGPVLGLLRQAAADPRVTSIEQTLYRTGAASPFVEALAVAARAGKAVTVVIELRARFDESANIDVAARLRSAGAKVICDVKGFKTHAKLLLITRQESDGQRRYAHLGTGNYHPGTSRLYTDISLLTADAALCEDVHQVFAQMTGKGRVRPLTQLIASPHSLRSAMIALIDAESEIARAGRPARIVAKMNGLSDGRVIAALYRASQAGVEIDLIVRGVCCLRPGVPGLSERIRVRSLIGRFLEHARVCCFHQDGRELVYCGSADWMERNLARRVEICFPVVQAEFKARIWRECLGGALQDNSQAWDLQPDGRYVRARPDGASRFALQEILASEA